ncbi:hypothetical protein HA466_0018730 [Hirschfeldia incana]|nr:hypothetical protein HA466_0018730 [Hirschfeldia incana]
MTYAQFKIQDEEDITAYYAYAMDLKNTGPVSPLCSRRVLVSAHSSSFDAAAVRNTPSVAPVVSSFSSDAKRHKKKRSIGDGSLLGRGIKRWMI